MGGRNLCSEPFGKQIAPSSGEIDQQDLNTLTVARLREMLETLGVEIIGRPRKAELISMIEEFLS
jgi:hypothetical protein